MFYVYRCRKTGLYDFNWHPATDKQYKLIYVTYDAEEVRRLFGLNGHESKYEPKEGF